MNNIYIFKLCIKHNTKHFLKMITSAAHQKTENKRINKAIEAACFASEHAVSVYSSEVLEQIFLKVAESHHADISETFQKGTVLHVMTEAYTTGGHTRCVERWMELAGKAVRHSCVLLCQKKEYPNRLKSAAEQSGGTFFVFDVSMPFLEKAMELRRMASSYEYVILHVHPADPTALVAFGTEEFRRPVIFFNHADHMFWLGVSVSDCVADLSRHGMERTLRKRKAARAFFLGIPQETQNTVIPDKEVARKKCGISSDAKVVFSSGSAAKYSPVGDSIFFDALEFLLKSDEHVLVVLIGTDIDKNKYVITLKRIFGARVAVLDSLDYQKEYLSWLACADLVLDSFPVGGGTAIIDAINAGKPVMTLNRGQAEFLLVTRALCTSGNEFKEKSLKVLLSQEFALEIVQEQHQAMLNLASTGPWLDRVHKMIAALPEQHHVYLFDTSLVSKEPDEDNINVCRWIQHDISHFFSINKILKFLCSITWNKKRKKVYIFNIKLIDIKK